MKPGKRRAEMWDYSRTFFDGLWVDTDPPSISRA
jgi:hypothetical protein